MASSSCCLVALFFAIATVAAHGQSPQAGFISIDCGNSKSDYVDHSTNLAYVADDRFIDVGSDFYIQSNYINSSVPTLQLNLRSFPDGLRNCYTCSRCLRTTMTISDPSAIYTAEALSLATANSTSVCLVNTGGGTPFISSLELRPFENGDYGEYANASQSVVLVTRRNFGASDSVRFPDDPYDRVWSPYMDPSWSTLSSTLEVNNSGNMFEPPSAVMQSAVTPASGSQLAFSWDSVSPDDELYAVLHFAELQKLTGNSTRVFNITRNGDPRFQWYTPPYLSADGIHSTVPFEGYSRYEYVLNATSDSTLPPIINAFEVYSLMQLTQAATDSGDVDAMMAIKSHYQLKRNWMGDPCSPKAYVWDGLNCSYNTDPPRITNINLTSRGLTGEIYISFAMLEALKYLDLSHNNFSGAIPDFLGSLSSLIVLDLSFNNLTGTVPDSLENLVSLQILNLAGNNFNGSVPEKLCKRSDAGLLTLRLDKNGCNKASSSRSKTAIVVIIAAVSGLLLLVVILVAVVWNIRKQQGRTSKTSVQPRGVVYSQQREHQISFESRQFTYTQLENITNKFTKVIGKGGFGMVYHGCLETGKQVAIKMRSVSSPQGMKEFLAEAQNLTKIYHRNLVSLVGYCMDGNCLALVYEYMKQGSLRDYLRDKTGCAKVLSWGQRLQIALEAAQGLDYLHKGCKPPIIHRDVKSSNILLSEELEARIGDFGYHENYQLTEKSDVYSFGVVLLELITGRPPIVHGPGNVHIVKLIAASLSRGCIEEIMDETLQGEYDATSAWKILDLALRCTADAGSQRPTMFEVVTQLKSCSKPEIASDRSDVIYIEGFNMSREISSKMGRACWGQLFLLLHQHRLRNPNSSYWDTVTQVPYVSDDRFIDVGSDFDIQSSYINSSVPTQELNLRSFPDGVRNCYTLKPVPQNKLRPLKNGLYAEYVNASQSVVLVTRRNMGATKSLRFPDDPYDRVWNPYNGPSWLTLSTNSTVDNRDDLYEPPVAVMQTAVTPKRVRQLRFFWDSVSPGDELYAVLYFAELRNLTGKATRMFNVTRNGESRFSWYTPPYLSVGYIYSVVPFEGYYRYRYVLHATSNSTLPPIINAFEVYSLMQLTQAATDSRDGAEAARALEAIMWPHDQDSTLDERMVGILRRRYDIPEEYSLSAPEAGQRAFDPVPKGFALTADALEAGLRLPLHPIIVSCISLWRISPSQITPNSWRYLVAFLGECHYANIAPTRNLFLSCFRLFKGSGGYFLAARTRFR
ncbi:receptor-like serine threonine-protein kinase [Musa troglodytarum]|uniref:non-specific serine/threonine protein kinase n=1 Tax=Musa troglodytarum TaxID=320322 RepID=A0A9E7FEV3_9LILI|nr:receptor-like serine threonine-protein kinase [Musa troglodytarum]